MRAVLVFSALLLVGLAAEVIGDPPTTPIPLTEGSCLNGGVFINEECDCQPYWGGRDCGDIVCVNGGYSTPDGFCHCPKGYYGIHCDAVKLARPVEGVFRTKQTFNLYIHNELTDWYGLTALQRIQNQTKTLLNDYKYDLFNLFVSKRKNTLLTTETDADVWNFQQFKTEDEFLPALEAVTPRRTHTYTCTEAAEFSYQKLLDSLKPITTVTSTSTTTTESIEDSTILIFTQYPPKSDPDALPKLKEYLRAFRIKLNVLIGADDILLDCNLKKNKGEKFKELTDLVHFTDGEISSFLMETDDSPDQLSPSFIRASASPQSHSRSTSDDCASKANTFEFQTDPYPNTYYIAVRTDQDSTVTISGTCSSGGEVTNLAVSEWGEFTLSSILSGAQQTCTLTVATTKGGCLATVYSVGGEKDVDRFDIFHSFASSDAMDTDSIHSFKKDNFYLTMHIDVWSFDNELPKYLITEFNGTATVWNEEIEDSVFDFVKRDKSTFEYQSNQLFSCPDDGVSWIQLNLNGFNVNGDAVAVLNRIIHLNCEDRKAPVDPTPPKLFRMDAEETTTKPDITLALLFSNSLPTSQYSRFILEGADFSMEDKFSEYGYLRFDGKESVTFDPTSKFKDFRTRVYDNAPDAILDYQENLFDRLEKLTANDRLKHDSLVSIAIYGTLTTSKGNNPPSDTALLSNLGSRLLFWGDVDTVKVRPDTTDDLNPYIRLAAVSAGHVILMDMSDFPDGDDSGDFYVSFALRDMYSSGPSQRLLSYSNLEWTKPDTQTSTSNPIGSLQVPEGTTEVFVSITLNVKYNTDVGSAFMLSLVLEGASDRIVISLDPASENQFKQYGSPGFTRSNLYTASFSVVGGETYDGTFTLLAVTPYTGAHIRFWTARNEDEVIPDLKYVDFNMSPKQPNNYLGAALQVSGQEEEEITLRFLNEKGDDPKKLDHEQKVTVKKGGDGIAHFVPYFCDSNQSTSLSKDMYTVQIKYSSTNFTYFRPMLCTDAKTVNADDCDVVDENGNVFCKASNPPFVRGPSGKLIDCSGVGQVYYDNGGYACDCDAGFSGESCQSSSCDLDITHLPGERDAAYRTLTFVFISPAGDKYSACSYLWQYYAADAKKMFQQTSSYDNIWQYTFLIYFNDGNVKTLYRGPQVEEFLKVFDSLSTQNIKFDSNTFCGPEDAIQQPIDIADVLNYAVESVGRDSRGIVFFYTSQSFLDIPSQYQLDKLVVSEDFYETVQAYQQHIYMITPVITEDIIALTTASGGVAIKVIDDLWTNDFRTNPALQVFDKIITGKIGWIGVLTGKEDRTWTISEEVQLFISTDEEHYPIITNCKTSVDLLTAKKVFPFDVDDDEDKMRTSWLTVDAATLPVEQQFCLVFAPEPTSDTTPDPEEVPKKQNVQVVILSTESTVQYAILGQGQAEVDKHSAGATTNSSKPIHISFDRTEDTTVFKPEINNWREAAREQCTFGEEFIPITNPFVETGPLVVDFTMTTTTKDDADPTSTDTKVSSISVPLVVTEIIRCVEGQGTFNTTGSFCNCKEGWSGPTCSQPTCGEGGTLNSHGDHCDCTGAEYGGLFCTDGKKSSFFEE